MTEVDRFYMEEKNEEENLTREAVLRLIEQNGGKASGLDLSGSDFEDEVDLSGLRLGGINLKDANLFGANLQNADLGFANLQGADLQFANLQDAWLEDAALQNANLQDAKLQNATLRFAEAQGVSMYRAQISLGTRLDDVDWGDFVVGEEIEGLVELAGNVYCMLKQWHSGVGMYDIAGRFYYREMEMQREARSWREEPHLKLWSWAMRLLCGYGEKPERLILSACIIIFGLAIAYFLLGSFSSSSFLDCLYYSLVSFTALGYGGWAPQPEGWVKGMGAVEATIGVFTIALFLVTFTRKMMR